jgi:hypothetical protein
MHIYIYIYIYINIYISDCVQNVYHTHCISRLYIDTVATHTRTVYTDRISIPLLHTHTHTHCIYTDCISIPLLPNNTAIVIFLHIRSGAYFWLDIMTGAQAWWWWLGEYATSDVAFYIPYSKQLTQVSRWDMNQWASPSQYKGQLRCLCTDNWTVCTGSFCSRCLCCFESEQLIHSDKHP